MYFIMIYVLSINPHLTMKTADRFTLTECLRVRNELDKMFSPDWPPRAYVVCLKEE